MKRSKSVKGDRNPPAKTVEFSCFAPGAASVFLAGTFNDWSTDAAPMHKTDDGTWLVEIGFPPGRYEYKFVIDGQWCCEPGCEVLGPSCPKCVPNQFGTMNRLLEVA